MARLRSVAHLGTTRSGQRCIARCAQSYLPATSSSQRLLSSFCQALCGHQAPERRASTSTMPSSRSGSQSGATRRTSSAKARSSSTKASWAAISARCLAVGVGPASCDEARRAGAPRARAWGRRRRWRRRTGCRGSAGGRRARRCSSPDGVPSCQRMGALRRLLEWRCRWCSKKPEREPGAQVVALRVEQAPRPPARPRRPRRRRRSSNTARTRGGEVARDGPGRRRGCPSLGEGERIAGGRRVERQAVGAGEHPGRADRQRVEGLGLGRAAPGPRSRGGRRSGRTRPRPPRTRARRRGSAASASSASLSSSSSSSPAASPSS